MTGIRIVCRVVSGEWRVASAIALVLNASSQLFARITWLTCHITRAGRERKAVDAALLY